MASRQPDISTFYPAIRNLDKRSLRLGQFGQGILIIGGGALILSAVLSLIGSIDSLPQVLTNLHIPSSMLDKLEAANRTAQQASAYTAQESGIIQHAVARNSQVTGDMTTIALSVAIISFITAFGAFFFDSNRLKKLVCVAIGVSGIILCAVTVDHFTSQAPGIKNHESRASIQASLEQEIVKGGWQYVGHPANAVNSNPLQLKYLRAQAALKTGDNDEVRTLLDEMGISDNTPVNPSIGADKETLFLLETSAYGAPKSAEGVSYQTEKINNQNFWKNNAEMVSTNAWATLGIGTMIYGVSGWIKRRVRRLTGFLNRTPEPQESHPALLDMNSNQDTLKWETLDARPNRDLQHANLAPQA